MVRKCMKCRTKNNLTEHHIVFQAYGGDNSKDNIGILCKKCHKEFHNSIPPKSNSKAYLKESFENFVEAVRIKKCVKN